MNALLSLLLATLLRPEVVAADVLSAWDDRRSAAYAAGDPAALRALYVPGSASGRADQAALRAYVDRGLRVDGLRTQLLAVRVLERYPRGWRLLVTDRLLGGVARGDGTAVVLPQDRPTTWRLGLRWGVSGWRVVEVRPQASPAASTASTSPSRNR